MADDPYADDLYERGPEVWRKVLGDAHVDRSLQRATDFDRDFQRFITQTAWGSVWTRPGLEVKTRSILTIAVLADRGLLKTPMHVQFVMGLRNAMPARRKALAFMVSELHKLLPGSTWTVAGVGRHQAEVRDWALELVGHTRTREFINVTPKSSVLRSPRLPLWSLQNSPSDVTGPTFRPEEIGPLDNDLIRNYAHDGEPIGERIIVHGRVIDENGQGMPNTLVEFWQANAAGRYKLPADRQESKPIDPSFRGWGRTRTDLYTFETIKPGRHGHKPMAPHINVWLAARGGEIVYVYVFDIHLQGDHETVFFDI